MRVLAAIVAPPHLALGGAARAAEQQRCKFWQKKD